MKWACERKRDPAGCSASRKMHLCASVHVYIWMTEASRWGLTPKSRRNKTETGRGVCAAKKKRGNVYSLLPRWWKEARGEEEDSLQSDFIAKALWIISCLCVHFFRIWHKWQTWYLRHAKWRHTFGILGKEKNKWINNKEIKNTCHSSWHRHLVLDNLI